MAKANVSVTPKGTLTGFVNILKADFKFDDAGAYKFKLELTKKEAAPIIKAIEEARDEAYSEFIDAFKANPKNKGKPVPKKMADLPFYEDEDSGKVVLSFKSKATYTDKDGNRKDRILPIFGATGRIKPEDVPNFGAGSEVKVAYVVNGFCNAALGAGCSLRIDSVKLIKPVEFGSGSDPFGDDDGEGYTPTASGNRQESFPDSDDSEGSGDEPDAEDDF